MNPYAILVGLLVLAWAGDALVRPTGRRALGLSSGAEFLLAGILIGLGEAIAMAYLDPITNGAASGVLPYAVMIAVLLVRPQGLFGWKRIERL